MLSIVLPAYNEEGSIAAVARAAVEASATIAAVPGVGEVEVIVVDDGSSDRTAERAREVVGVRVVSYPRNRGYGAALKTGFAAARGDLVAFCDADGTCRPAAFADLARKLHETHGDIVIGSRLARGSEMPAVRRLGNRMFAVLLGIISLRAVTDTASGMRLLTRDAYDRVSPLPDGMNFTPAMTAKALLSGTLRIHEVPMPYGERDGESKLSVVRDGFRFLRTIVETALLFQPFRLLGSAGGVLAALSLFLLAEPLRQLATTGGVEDGMVFRLISVAVFLIVAQTFLAAGVVAESLKEGVTGVPASPNPLRRLGALVLRPKGALLTSLTVATCGVALNAEGLVRFAGHGDVGPLPWYSVLAGGYLVVTGAQVFVGGLTHYLGHLLRQQMRKATGREDPGLVAAGLVPAETSA